MIYELTRSDVVIFTSNSKETLKKKARKLLQDEIGTYYNDVDIIEIEEPYFYMMYAQARTDRARGIANIFSKYIINPGRPIPHI